MKHTYLTSVVSYTEEYGMRGCGKETEPGVGGRGIGGVWRCSQEPFFL